MTYDEALARLPDDACISCTFGWRGCDHYTESFRTTDGRVFWVERHDSYDTDGWSFRTIEN